MVLHWQHGRGTLVAGPRAGRIGGAWRGWQPEQVAASLELLLVVKEMIINPKLTSVEMRPACGRASLEWKGRKAGISCVQTSLK